MAHEFGHSIGIHHIDEYKYPPNLVSGCLKYGNSIMSRYLYSNNYYWDKCSLNFFKINNIGYPFNCRRRCIYKPSRCFK